MSDPIQALAEASAWNLKHQERIRELERQLAEAQAQAGALRDALQRARKIVCGYERASESHLSWLDPAFAPEAGRNYRASILEEAVLVGNRLWEKWAIGKAEPAGQAAVAEYQNAIRALAQSTSPDP